MTKRELLELLKNVGDNDHIIFVPYPEVHLKKEVWHKASNSYVNRRNHPHIEDEAFDVSRYRYVVEFPMDSK